MRKFILVATILSILTGIGLFIYLKKKREKLAEGLNLAHEYYNKKDLVSAKNLLVTLSKDYPRNDELWNFLGSVYMEMGESVLAEKAYRKALKADDTNAKALCGVGVLYYNRKEYDTAETFFRRSLEADPDYAKAYSSLVMIALVKRHADSAVIYAEKANALEQGNAAIQANLALAYHFANRTTQRDSLMQLLEQKNNSLTVAKLKLLFNGEVAMDSMK